MTSGGTGTSRASPSLSRVVRNVRARVQHAPRIPREGVVFRGPPDRADPCSHVMCIAKAYETQTTILYRMILVALPTVRYIPVKNGSFPSCIARTPKIILASMTDLKRIAEERRRL